MTDIQTTEHFGKFDDGSIKVKSKAVLKPYMIFKKEAPTMICYKRKFITKHLTQPSYPTEKIDFGLFYDDSSLIDFFPVGKTCLHYRGDLKVAKERSRGIAATRDYLTFTAGYGITSIRVSIPSSVYIFIIEKVIEMLRSRKELKLDRDWENRFRNQFLLDEGGFTTFNASMHNCIPTVQSTDITKIMKMNKMSCHGLGFLGVRLIRVWNPDQRTDWQLRFTVRKMIDVQLYDAKK